MYEIVKGIAYFIHWVGGPSKLTKMHCLYIFGMYKARVSGLYDWRTVATRGISDIPDTEVPQTLTADDVRYMYYMVTGSPEKAQALADAGKVSLDMEDEIDGNSITEESTGK